MLEEKHLDAASILCALLGIAMLFFLGSLIEPRETSIGKIDASLVGQRVSVFGKVEWALEKEGFVLLTLNDGAKINAIKFSPTKEERALCSSRNFVQVTGKVQEYEKELEIVAEEIRQWQ